MNPPDAWNPLREFTDARIALGRSGASLPTREVLNFGLAHARARDAIHQPFASDQLVQPLAELGLSTLTVRSAASDRHVYLNRPDLGRQLNEESRADLAASGARPADLLLVIGDGLSSYAVQRQAVPLIRALLPYLKTLGLSLAPVVLAHQSRVALGDDIGETLKARAVAILIGERPGLSSPDSLGVYLTWQPHRQRLESERNCISNIPDPNNRHHLIPDPETAPIVKQVFAMFVSGVRMCEIQKWLAENKVLTIGALRYQRTGQARYQRAMIAPYTWPDKTLYDILARQEYLGHTITAKTHKVSYKSKKTRKNEEEQRYFFPNTHEPLVDEETFELAQKRIATRHRPTKAAEIDIFSGLLFCAGCGHKMYYQQGVNIEPRKFSYSCGAWRNRARTGSECTSHYIRKNVLLDLVLEDMRRVLRYVKEHEQDFICKATEYGDMEARKALAQQQKELFKAQARMTELDTLFRKLYEDNALGRLTDERFVFLTSGYEDEKKSLAARIDELQQQIATVTERKRDISRFIQIVGKYSDIQELTYENVHEFIDRILIHELDRETNTRKIEIHYSFVGQVDTEQEPTQVVNHDRRNMVDVKSIAI